MQRDGIIGSEPDARGRWPSSSAAGSTDRALPGSGPAALHGTSRNHAGLSAGPASVVELPPDAGQQNETGE
jgi:hypothetical protein